MITPINSTSISDKPRPLLICFVGIDGGGKSTNARKIVDWMRERNIEIDYFWNKYEPFLLKPIMKLGKYVFLRDQDMFRDYTGYQKSKKKAFQIPVIITFFHFFYISEYLLRTLFSVKLPLLLGRSVICDRYFFDIVAGISSDFNYTESERNKILRFFMHILPVPDVAFLIDLPEEVAYKRKNDIPSIEFLAQKRKIYLSMAEFCNMEILDGCGNLEDTENIIKDKIMNLQKV